MIPKSVKLLFIIPFVIIIGYSVYLCTVYSSIPDTIPVRSFGNSKESYGNKIFLFLPILLNLIILFLSGGSSADLIKSILLLKSGKKTGKRPTILRSW